MREGEGRGAVGSRFKGLRGGGRWMGVRRGGFREKFQGVDGRGIEGRGIEGRRLKGRG